MIDQLQIAIERLLDLKADIAILRLKLALKKYNPTQPRWPAGRSDGGQWRQVDSNEVAQVGYDAARVS